MAKHPTALLLVDVINHFDFPGGDCLLENARTMTGPILDLKRRAKQAGVPVIYANDNFGQWLSDFNKVLQYCLEDNCRGREFARQLAPAHGDYVILKPKHSAFFHTPLELLLKHLGTRHIIVTGLATNNCILFTAHDGYMRDLKISVPADCVAAETQEQHQAALEQMRVVTKRMSLPLMNCIWKLSRMAGTLLSQRALGWRWIISAEPTRLQGRRHDGSH